LIRLSDRPGLLAYLVGTETGSDPLAGANGKTGRVTPAGFSQRPTGTPEGAGHGLDTIIRREGTIAGSAVARADRFCLQRG
jgi:hypothetical protein